MTARDILGVRAELLANGLSVKYVKNILGASFKAMIRDAREIDGVIDAEPFVGVRWPRVEVPGPGPSHAGRAHAGSALVRDPTVQLPCRAIDRGRASPPASALPRLPAPPVLDGHAAERGVRVALGRRRP